MIASYCFRLEWILHTSSALDCMKYHITLLVLLWQRHSLLASLTDLQWHWKWDSFCQSTDRLSTYRFLQISDYLHSPPFWIENVAHHRMTRNRSVRHWIFRTATSLGLFRVSVFYSAPFCLYLKTGRVAFDCVKTAKCPQRTNVHVIVAGEVHRRGRFNGRQCGAVFELNEIPERRLGRLYARQFLASALSNVFLPIHLSTIKISFD